MKNIYVFKNRKEREARRNRILRKIGEYAFNQYQSHGVPVNHTIKLAEKVFKDDVLMTKREYAKFKKDRTSEMRKPRRRGQKYCEKCDKPFMGGGRSKYCYDCKESVWQKNNLKQKNDSYRKKHEIQPSH